MATKRARSEVVETKQPKKEGRESRKVTVAATQMDCSNVNEEVNHAKAEHWVRAAAQAGADVVLLQELFSGPYFCIDMLAKHFALAKPAKGHPLLTRMSILAKELNIVIPVSFFEASGNVFYNSLCMIDSDGSQLGIYRKSHIPDGNGYSEKFYFTPGDTGFKVWDTKKCRIGVAICWDQWFPEAARAMSLEGAEILFYPTAIGSEPHDATIDSHEHWRRTMQGHAAANYRPVVASNRAGKELSLANKEWSITFYGTSFIADETGGIVKDMDKTSEGVITHTFDLDEIAANRSAWGMFRDRRPDLYSSLCSHGGEWGGSSYFPQSTPSRQRIQPLATSNGDASSPTQLEPTDYRMPAEWEPHFACWIGFPQREDNWPQHAAPAQENFIAVVKAISQFEPVNVCVPSNLWLHVSQVFKDFPTVRVIELAQDDSWFRDTAPTFVVPRSVGKPNINPLAGVCWGFNGYGGLYECHVDKLISSKICAMEKVPAFHPGLVLEGGAIHVDGLGTLITTEQCLLGPNVLGKFRNPGVTKGEIEELFKRYLGVTKVLWIPRGVLTDLDTNGHVDNMCCFLRPGVVALHWVERSEDPAQHAISQEAFNYLSSQTDALGRSFEIIKVLPPRNLLRREDEVCPQPIGSNSKVEDAFGRQASDPLPGSYVNFFMPNGAAIVPQFGDVERDALALTVYQKHLPSRKVVGLPARQVLVGGGCIHCILMQQPEGNRG